MRSRSRQLAGCFAPLLLLAGMHGCGRGDHARRDELARLFGPRAGAPTTQAASNASPASKTGAQAAGEVARPPKALPPVAGATVDAPIAQTTPPSLATPSAPTQPGPRLMAGASVLEGGTRAAAPPSSDSAGSTSPLAGSGSSAACKPGELNVANRCVCDLNGAFALVATLPVALPAMGPVEALRDAIQLWGLVKLTYDAQGLLSLNLHTCGSVDPDICTAAQPPLVPSAEAYAQFVSTQTWDMPATSASNAQLSLPLAVAGAQFDTPTLAELHGIELTDPFGPWPTSHRNVEGDPSFDGTQVNGARWDDLDRDGHIGMTVRLVAPGGVRATQAWGPPRDYGSTSAACPRENAAAPRSSYAYLPVPQGLGVKRIAAIHVAERLLLEMHGQIESCDLVRGTLTGPNAGNVGTDLLVGGCAEVSANCSSALVDAVTSGGGASAERGLETGDFTLTRAPPDADCAWVRNSPFKQ